MKVKVIVKRNKEEIDFSMPTNIRCFIHDSIDISKLDSVIANFNDYHVTTTNHALIKVGRSKIKNIVAIDIAICTFKQDNDIPYVTYNSILHGMLNENKIEHEFIHQDDSFANTIDETFISDKTYNISIDRDCMDTEIFNDICRKLIPDVNIDDIYSVRIPYNSVICTKKAKWVKKSSDNDKSNSAESEDIKTKCNNCKQTRVFSLHIVNEDNSKLLDEILSLKEFHNCYDIIQDNTTTCNYEFSREIYIRTSKTAQANILLGSCSILGEINIIE